MWSQSFKPMQKCIDVAHDVYEVYTRNRDRVRDDRLVYNWDALCDGFS